MPATELPEHWRHAQWRWLQSKHPVVLGIFACREVDVTRSIRTVPNVVPELAPLGCLQDGAIVAAVRRRAEEALRLLAEARRYAQELERSEWDFALEIEALQKVGCTVSELRWLVCKGYVMHAREVTMVGESSRTFRPARSAGLKFSRRTCFVLTDPGYQFASGLIACPSIGSPTPAEEPNLNGSDRKTVAAAPYPKWDRDRQELRLGKVVIKQFKVPAANQERVLAAFEEEGWPVRIDDPLPPAGDQDPKRRLHDTINSLNRNQKRSLIRFVGDGSGQGIRWERVVEDNHRAPSGNGRPACDTCAFPP